MASGQPILTKVTIDNIDVTSYLKTWNIKDTEGDDYIKYASVILDRSVSAVLTLTSPTLSTKTVEIWRGVSSATEKKIFSGEVTNFIPTGADIELKCADKLYIAHRKTITKSFDIDLDTEAGVLSEIFKTLINDYTDGDLQATDDSVTTSGDTTKLKKFICRADVVYDKCKELADAIGYIFYYKPDDDLVYFEPKATNNNSTTIQDGTNLIKSPEWNYDSTKIVNHVETRGAVQDVETTELGRVGVTTGYSTTDVALDFSPLSTKIYADDSTPPTTLRRGGKAGVSGNYDYSVDQNENKINWNKDTYHPSTNHYVQIDYTYGLPTPIISDSSASKNSYGIKRKIIQLKNIKNVDDAYVFARQYIDDYANPLLSAKLEVIDVSDLEVGQQVRIIDSINDIDEWLIINAVEMSYPYNKDIIRVGSFIKGTENLLFNIVRKIKAIEEENAYNEETLGHYFTADVNYIKLENRFVSLYNNQNTLILNHATRGLLDGTNYFAGGTTDSQLVIRHPGEDNTYKEFVYDNYFYNVGSSASTTWNATTETITISTTGYVQTEYVSKGMTSFADYRLNIASTNGGTKTYKVRGAIDAPWQEPTLDTWTNFTGTVDAVSIKIENADSPSIIQNTYNNKKEYDDPAIKLELRE